MGINISKLKKKKRGGGTLWWYALLHVGLSYDLPFAYPAQYPKFGNKEKHISPTAHHSMTGLSQSTKTL